MKPENILLNDISGHVMLCDFDLAAEMEAESREKNVSSDGMSDEESDGDRDGGGVDRPAFVGTEEYIAPEVIKGWPHTAAADWWGLAILLYELTHGRTPFRARWREQTFDFITTRRVEFPKPEEGGPDPVLSDECKGIIRGMTRRTGVGQGAYTPWTHLVCLNSSYVSLTWTLTLHNQPH